MSLISLYRKRANRTTERTDQDMVNNNKINAKNENIAETKKPKIANTGVTQNNKNNKCNNSKMEKIKNKSNQSRKVKFNFEPTDTTLYPEPLSDKKKINKATKKQGHAFKKPFPTNTEEIYKEEYHKNKEEKEVSPDMKHFLSRIGAGDQILKVKKKCSNVILGFLNHKKHYIEKQPPPAPLFAVKVDSSNFQVLNSAEIKRKVKAMGNVAKNETCVCPSRLKKAKQYGIGDTCETGICELAGKDKYNRFNCKCVKKAIVECSDTTCDEPFIKQTKLRKNLINNYVSPKTNNPMFQMVLDNNHMNILNTGEIKDVIKTASYTGICPTGVCKQSARNKRAVLNCKCVNKKLSPGLYECDERTCKPKRSLFYIICSRIFSGTDDWNTARRTYNPNRRRALQLGPNINQYGGVRRNLENNTNVECMCNCECDKKSVKKNKKKKVKRKPFAKKHPVVKRTSIFKKENMSKKFHQQEVKFSKLKKKRAKEQRKKEKEEQRKKIKLQKEIEKLAMKESNNTNFLGNFVNGVLNLTLQTVRRFFTVIVSIIFDPINSYLYTKDKVSNPLDSAKSFKRWIVDTWKSKDSKFYKTIADSNAINVLADHLEDSAVFQTFTNKGRTQVERKIYERKFKLRKKRMRKRHDAALYGCRHMLLTTLRKHPCKQRKQLHSWFLLQGKQNSAC
ncbi:uncharacterized protein LOC123692618 [Colias croceus]|uniref:uncharacterized protein LOC123692618 n=1 Tax=Colias crocea TaxID=72248 RepID=UPI001E27D55B|nr:uncharacterized protein LOC123692618 [Colias croceus]